MEVEITIIKWKEHQSLKVDGQGVGWFKVKTGISSNAQLQRVPPSARWLWVCLLSLAAKEGSKTFKKTLNELHWTSDLTLESVKKYLSEFKELGLIHLKIEEKNRESRVEDRKGEESFERERELNVHLKNGRVNDSFSFPEETILSSYSNYPRKEGKQQGIRTLRRNIKSMQNVEDFSKAVDNYAKHVELNNPEPKFIKMFSTFANCWQDYVELEPKDLSKKRDKEADEWDERLKKAQEFDRLQTLAKEKK